MKNSTKNSTRSMIVREISKDRTTRVDVVIWALLSLVFIVSISSTLLVPSDEDVEAAESTEANEQRHEERMEKLEEVDARYEQMQHQVIVDQTADHIVNYVTAPFTPEVVADELEEKHNEDQEPLP